MKITTVTYGRSIEFSRHRKTWFAWTAEVDPGESAEHVIGNLRAMADEEERREFSRYGDNRPEPPPVQKPGMGPPPPLPVPGPGRPR